ncbi:hypothetical protein LCGC14_3003700, partial [marine sediment metagenome]
MALINSPLRYPGGKSALSDFLSQVILENNLEGGVYAEPYCGGAGAALNLLFAEYVEKIILNDADRSIYAFWWSVLHQSGKLIELIDKTPVNIEHWQMQKEIYNNQKKHSLLKVGFATFFLNRCNRSGILLKA